MTYTISQDEEAMFGVFMCLQINIIGFDMPTYTTHAFKCVRLQVNITGFEMPIYTNDALKCVRLQVNIIQVLRSLYIQLTH